MADKTTDALYDIHPGAVIKFDYLEPLNLTPYRLAKTLEMGQTHLADIIDGRRSVTANVAIRLATAFGTTPDFWLNLQNRYDMLKARSEFNEIYDRIEPLPIAA